ncbi:MAG: GNAT family N-acetyltransferase [Candidatus Marinimicrobia bacterium]|nr:GNAT family N-acetyltransferase [Candidatus Neomarinimicrobiota bacterium]
MVEIREITTRRDLKHFVKFHLNLYKNNPFWAPPLIIDEMDTLDKTKNAAFKVSQARYWLAYKENKIVGRIAGIYNENHYKRWHKKQLRFGWFDFIDDPEVAGALLEQVENWGKEMEMESVIGPMGFTDMDRNGMLVEGFDQLGTYAANYNYPYYPEIIEKLGYRPDVDWIEYKIKAPQEIPEIIPKLADRTLRNLGLRIVNFKKRKDIMKYADPVFELIMETYRILYGYVDLEEEQIKQYTQKYIGFLKPKFITVVESNNGEVVGFGITMPSMTKGLQKANGRLFPFGLFQILREMKKTKIIDLYLIGVKPEYQRKGVTTIILNKMAHDFIKMGIEYGESNPELEHNRDVQNQWKHFHREQHKRRRVFIKEL